VKDQTTKNPIEQRDSNDGKFVFFDVEHFEKEM